jgi:urease accessory protein
VIETLQLVSPTLPIGAYGYSEGLEYLCQIDRLNGVESLKDWLEQELIYGAIA